MGKKEELTPSMHSILDRLAKRLEDSKIETDRKIAEVNAETKRQMAKSRAEVDKEFKALAKSRAEVDEKFKELATQIARTDAQINGVSGRQDHRWGQFVESLVAGDLAKLLSQKGIDVKKVLSRKIGETEDRKHEFDLIAENAFTIVVIEVKSTLRSEDVGYFIGKLVAFKQMFPKYKNKRIYGAVAYLKSDENTIKFSERQGLFVIRATGNSASIINPAGFEPKGF